MGSSSSPVSKTTTLILGIKKIWFEFQKINSCKPKKVGTNLGKGSNYKLKKKFWSKRKKLFKKRGRVRVRTAEF